MLNFIRYLLIVCLLSAPACLFAQAPDSSRLDKLLSFPDRMFASLGKKAEGAQARLDRQTDRYLSKMQRREEKLRRKLWKKDSATAKALFPDVEAQYAKLRNVSGKVG